MRDGLLLMLSLLPVILCAQDDSGEILARVGNDVVTAQEFRERFELLPRRLAPGDPSQAAAKEELILSLIAEKLLARAAREQGVDRDALYQADMARVRRLLARDQLYRVEVQHKVTVSPEEIAKSILYARRKLLLEYVHADDSVSLSGFSFAEDTAARRETALIRDTITVRWGEAEAALERAVFALAPGEVSAITPSSVGWFVCRVLSEVPDEVAERSGPLELRKRVEEVLRLRKEEERLDAYMRVVLKTSLGKAAGRGFNALTGAMRTYASDHPEVIGRALTAADRDSVLSLLGRDAQDTLLVMQTTVLSVGQVLDRLTATGFRPMTARFPDLESDVNDLLRVWTWQGILEEVAMARGMDAHPEVDRQLRMWQAHYLAEAVRRKFIHDASVSDVELHRVRRSLDPSCDVPTVDAELIWAKEDSTVLRVLAGGLGSLMHAPAPQTVDHAVRHILLEDVELLSLQRLADALADVPAGIWTRPLATDSAFVSVRILAEGSRPDIPPATRDSLVQMLKEMKGRRAEAIFTAAAASANPYTVYEDRLRTLQVSGVPMMSFRLLGFGGRMFAVPFVRPRTDWYVIDQESGRVLP